MTKQKELLQKVSTVMDSMKGVMFFTDFHAHKFEEFAEPTGDKFVNTRFKSQVETLDAILYTAKETGQPVICGGDLFHKRGAVDTNVFNRIYETFQKYPTVPVLIVRGNHDSVDNSINSTSSLEPLEALDNVIVASTPTTVTIQGITVNCLPYGHEIDEMKQFLKEVPPADLLVAHIGVEGAREGSGHSLSGAFTVGDLHPEKYNSVLLGHYHKRQKLAEGVHYGGSTIPMNFGDLDTKGILLVNPKEKHQLPTFIEISNPLFVTVNVSEDSQEEVQKAMEGNFVRLRGNTNDIQRLVALDNVPVNIRPEVHETFEVESRIDISAESTPEQVVTAYCKEYAPNVEETALFYIQRSMKEGF